MQQASRLRAPLITETLLANACLLGWTWWLSKCFLPALATNIGHASTCVHSCMFVCKPFTTAVTWAGFEKGQENKHLRIGLVLAYSKSSIPGCGFLKKHIIFRGGFLYEEGVITLLASSGTSLGLCFVMFWWHLSWTHVIRGSARFIISAPLCLPEKVLIWLNIVSSHHAKSKLLC